MFFKQTARINRHSRRGFSLVELMVVIVIIGLLASVVTFSVRSYLISSKQNVAKLEISKMMQAMDTFYTAFSRYPSNDEGLAVLAAKTEEFPDGIITFIPDDPWGHAYEYLNPGRSNAFDIICYGADHREGGTGGDRDLRSDEIQANR